MMNIVIRVIVTPKEWVLYNFQRSFPNRHRSTKIGQQSQNIKSAVDFKYKH